MKKAAEKKNLVLDHHQVVQKIKRMAFEIYENNFREKSIILAGIEGQGYTLAQMLAEELKSISPLTVVIAKVSLDKLSPQQSEVILDVEVNELRKKCIILMDDVLNTGRTLAYGMKPFLDIEVKKIEVAVLVNRSHTMFPILPQYNGYHFPQR